MVTIELVDSVREVKKLEDDWTRLSTLAPGFGIGATFDQNLVFERDLAGKFLKVLVARERGGVVGIAPLRLTRVKWRSIEARKVSFITPRYMTSDFLLDPGQRVEVLRSFITFLLREETDWDYMELCSLLQDSPTVQMVEKISREFALPLHSASRGSTLSVSLEGSWDSYISSRGAHLRKRYREAASRLYGLGVWNVQRTRSPDGTGGLIKRMTNVMTRSWKGKRQTLASGLRLMTDQFELASARGGLDVQELSLNGETEAFWFLSHQGPMAYALYTAYVEDLSDYSPGFVLLHEVVKNLFSDRSRVSELDFLNNLPYLRRWANLERRRVSLTLYHRGLRAQLVKLGRGVIHGH